MSRRQEIVMSCNRWILILCVLGSAAGSAAAAGDWTDPSRISVEASVPFAVRGVRVAIGWEHSGRLDPFGDVISSTPS